MSDRDIEDMIHRGIKVGYELCTADCVDALASILPYVGIEPDAQDEIMDKFREKVKNVQKIEK